MVLGCIPVAGDGHCLFHALGYLDGRDGAALRNEVGLFMLSKAPDQHGFVEVWYEEADELLQGTWGGHTAIIAYSLMTDSRVEIHTLTASGAVVITDASHPAVANDGSAPLRRVLYTNNNHYDALVELSPNPSGWIPAWEQPPPPIYFKQVVIPACGPGNFPPLGQAAQGSNPKAPKFNKPRPPKKSKGKKRPAAAGHADDARQEEAQPAVPAQPKPHPLTHCRIVTKTTPPPELRDDIMTDLAVYGVRPKTAHPHRKQEDLIKASARKVCQCEKVRSDIDLFRGPFIHQ